MAIISPSSLEVELRLREKSQNYTGILKTLDQAKKETNAARDATGGNAVGTAIGGFESLIRVANNLVENAESTAKAVIAKVNPDGHGVEAQPCEVLARELLCALIPHALTRGSSDRQKLALARRERDVGRRPDRPEARSRGRVRTCMSPSESQTQRAPGMLAKGVTLYFSPLC